MAFPSYVTVLIDGYGEAHAPTTMRTEMDRGMPKQRKTQSDVLVSTPLTLLFNRAVDAANFEDWYYTDAGAGTVWFDWTDPRTNIVRQARIVANTLGPLVPEVGGFALLSRTLTIEYIWSSSFLDGSLILDFLTGEYKIRSSNQLAIKNFADIFTFTRASSGWHYNSAGVLVQAAANAPRFDYDPVTLAAKGLLIEEQRTNLLLNSDGTVAQLNTKSAVTDAAAFASYFARSIQIPAGATEHYAYKSFTFTGGVTYCTSIYVRMDDGAAPVPSTSSASGDFSVLVSGSLATALSVSPVGGGVYRVSGIANVATGAAANYGVVRYAAQSGKGFRVTGYQLEVGTFPTSYIPTTAAQVTRSADLASINTLSPWFNAVEGTLYGEVTHAAGNANYKGIMCFNDGTNANRILLAINPGEYGALFTQVAGAVVVASSANAASASAANKLAATYGAGSTAVSLNGGAVASGITGAPVVDRLAIGRTSSGALEFLNGHIKNLRYFPRRLTNAELQALTA